MSEVVTTTANVDNLYTPVGTERLLPWATVIYLTSVTFPRSIALYVFMVTAVYVLSHCVRSTFMNTTHALQVQTFTRIPSFSVKTLTFNMCTTLRGMVQGLVGQLLASTKANLLGPARANVSDDHFPSRGLRSVITPLH